MSDQERRYSFTGDTNLDTLFERIAAAAGRAEQKIPGFGKALSDATRSGQNSLQSLMQTLESADAGFERSITKRRASAEVEAERQARHQAKIQRILEQSAAQQVTIQNKTSADVERVQSLADARREAQLQARLTREKQEAEKYAADMLAIAHRYESAASMVNRGAAGAFSPDAVYNPNSQRYQRSSGGQFDVGGRGGPGGNIPGAYSAANAAGAAAQFETLTDAEKQAAAAAQAFERELDRVAQKTQQYGPELRTTLAEMRAGWEQMGQRVAQTYANMDVPPSVIRSLDAMERKVISLEQSFTKVGSALQTKAATPAALKSQEQALENLFNKIDVGSHQANTNMSALDATLRKQQDASYMAENGLRRVDGELKQKPADAEKADKAMRGLGDTFKDMWKQFVVGSVASQVVMRALDGITASAKSLIENNAQIEKFEMTYVRFFGNVAAAKQEMDTVIKEAPKFPEELGDIVALDQKLIGLLGTPDKLQGRFGRSMGEVRKAILDTKATLENVDTANVARDLQLLQDRPGDAIRSLERMSILTREELAKQGIQFDVHGKNIYSSYEDTFNAVIKIMQNKFGGMAEVQSSTFSGMLANTKDFLFRATSYLGADVFADIRERFKGFLDQFDDTKNPGVTRTLQDWGVKIGKVWNGFMTFFDDVGKGVGVLLQVLRPVTDMLGWLIDQLPSSVAAQKDGWDNLAKAAGYVADNVEDQADATQVTSQRQRDLEQALKANERAADGIRDKYQKQLDTLSDQERSLDRIYQKGKEDRQISELRLKIAADMALAQDKASSQGRSAAERLVGEQRQLTDLYAEQAHNKEKDRLQDAKTGTERARDKELDTNRDARRGIQDELDAIREQLDFNNKLKSSYNELDKSHRRNVDDQTAANTDWLTSSDKTTNGVLAGLNKLTDAITGDKGLSAAADGLRDAWTKLLDTFGLTEDKSKPAHDTFQTLAHDLGLDAGLGRAVILVKTLFINSFEQIAALMPVFGEYIGGMLGSITDQLGQMGAWLNVLGHTGTAMTDPTGYADALKERDRMDAKAAANETKRHRSFEDVRTEWLERSKTITDQNVQDAWQEWLKLNKATDYPTSSQGSPSPSHDSNATDRQPGHLAPPAFKDANLAGFAQSFKGHLPSDSDLATVYGMTPAQIRALKAMASGTQFTLPGPPAQVTGTQAPLPGEHGSNTQGSTTVTLKVAGASGDDWVLGKLRLFRNDLGQMVAQQVLGAM